MKPNTLETLQEKRDRREDMAGEQFVKICKLAADFMILNRSENPEYEQTMQAVIEYAKLLRRAERAHCAVTAYIHGHNDLADWISEHIDR